MKETTYRGLTIQHPTITEKEIVDICDWYATTFYIKELDCDSGSLMSAKLNIDSLYEDMDKFNAEYPDDAVDSILSYITEVLAY
jgi:predicted metal-dependent TIM-barrel fold hydrolase